jgi:hypothetical protein
LVIALVYGRLPARDLLLDLAPFAGPTYAFLSGTSQAAPLVSFAAALLAAKEQNFSAESIKQRLLSTCDWEPSARMFVANGCELNMAKALATRTDVVELKSAPTAGGTQASTTKSVAHTQPAGRPGPLLRGEVKNRFILRRGRKSDLVNVDGQLRRIWFGDGEPRQSVLRTSKAPVCGNIEAETGTAVQLTLEDGLVCPPLIPSPLAAIA